jgi:hypothetical protein
MMTEARAEVPVTTVAEAAAGDAQPSRAARRFPDVIVRSPHGSAASRLTRTAAGVGAHLSLAPPAYS